MSLAELEKFTADMFRGPFPRIYIIGPNDCKKKALQAELYAAGLTLWNPHRIYCEVFQTFMCVPALTNQYFILFKGATDYECGKSRIPEPYRKLVQELPENSCLLYDSDHKTIYIPMF